MKNTVPLWHRRNVKWTQEDIDALIEYRLVQFLPSNYATKQPRLPRGEQQELKRDLRSQIDKRIEATAGDRSLQPKLEALVEALRPVQLTDERLDIVIRGEIVKLLPSGAINFVPLEGVTMDDIARSHRREDWKWDLTLVLRATDYVRVSLGLYPRLYKGEHKPDAVGGRYQQQLNSLSKTGQLSCVKEWTGVYDDIWNNPVWRECLAMRYDGKNAPAAEMLHPDIRKRLGKVCKQLLATHGDVMPGPEEITTASDGDDVREWKGFAHGVLKFDYLSALLDHSLGTSHRLLQPLNDSGLFERVAVLEAEKHCPHATRSNYVERFCRYLTVAPRHTDELMGQLIVRVLRIEAGYWEEGSANSDLPANSKRLPKLRPEEMGSSDEYKIIVNWMSKSLKLERKTLNRLWVDWCALKLGHFWRRRSATRFTAYWMAYILEMEHGSVFRDYSKRVNTFLIEKLRPLIQSENPKSPRARHDALAAFQEALLLDPFLQIVLHYEAFGGRREVRAPRSFSKHETKRTIHLMVTHACRFLLKTNSKPPRVSIERLADHKRMSNPQVLAALKPQTKDSVQLGGYSPFSIVGPLVTAMVNDGQTVITRDNAKTIYRRNRSNYLLVELESDPDGLLARTIRGEVPV